MTGIEWVLNPDGTRGITVNSKTGCLNHTPEGLCLGGLFPCYAFGVAHRRLKQRYLLGGVFSTNIEYSTRYPNCILDPFYPRFWPERLEKIRKIKKPTGVFLDDMSDWMWEGWPKEWTHQELQVMRDCPQHRFYTLTKQPQRLPEFSPFPDNAWVGVTATNQEMFDTAYDYLSAIKASIRFISLEPLLSSVSDLSLLELKPKYIDWLIIGACTGNLPDMTSLGERYPDLWLAGYSNKITAQPKFEWVKEIVQAAYRAGTPVLLKDNLVSFPFGI